MSFPAFMIPPPLYHTPRVLPMSASKYQRHKKARKSRAVSLEIFPRKADDRFLRVFHLLFVIFNRDDGAFVVIENELFGLLARKRRF